MFAQPILEIGSLPLPKRVKGISERGRIIEWIMGDRGQSVHELRHEVMATFESLVFLGPGQQSDLEMVIGEALDNACKCSSDQHPVDIAWEKSPSVIHLRIANPSDKCQKCQINHPDCSAEHGRGLAMIKTLVTEINDTDGIYAGCGLYYYFRRMVFRFVVGC